MSGKVSGIRYTRAALLREQMLSARAPKQKDSKEQIVARGILNTHRSHSRAPAIHPNSPVKKTLSDSALTPKTQFRRLLEERTVYKTAQSYAEMLVYHAIQSDAENHKKHLSYRFFHKFTGNPSEELPLEEIKKLMRKPDLRAAVYDLYSEELALRLVPDPLEIGLDPSSPIEDLEASLQSANNFVLLSHAFDRQFRDTFPGPPEKIFYFFECLKNRTWRQTVERLDLKFHPFDLKDPVSIGLTWIPSTLYTKTLPALKELILANQYLTTLPKRFFSHSRELRLLDITDNPLLRFPKDFGRAWRLETLLCPYTHIRRLSRPLFENCPYLRTLDASHNPYLERIHGNPSIAWRCLQSIDLSHTLISSFPFTFASPVVVNLDNTDIDPQFLPESSQDSIEDSISSEASIKENLSVQDLLIQAQQAHPKK